MWILPKLGAKPIALVTREDVPRNVWSELTAKLKEA